MTSVILKVNVKWRLIDGFPFNEAPMTWFVYYQILIGNFQYYLCTVCSLLWTERYTTLLEPEFRLLSLMQYSLLVLTGLNVSVVTTFLHIPHLLTLHDLKQPFFFSRIFLGSYMVVFQIFTLPKLIYRNILGNFSMSSLAVSVFQAI